MMDPNEFIGSCGDVEVRLFFVYEECVGHPNVFDEFGADRERFDARPFSEGQSGIGPELSEVEVQGEILKREIERNKRKFVI